MPLEVVNNTSVWVSFAQEARREVVFAAERMRLEPEQLQREAFKNHGRGWCYVRGPGLPTTLVRVKQQHPKAVPASQSLLGKDQVGEFRKDQEGDRPRRIIGREVGTYAVRDALPPPMLEVQELLARIDRTGHCYLWTGPVDKDGYGVTRWNGKPGQRVHRIVYELAYGAIPVGPDGK